MKIKKKQLLKIIKEELLKENIQELFATIRQLINAGQYDRAYAQIMVQIDEDDPKHKMAIDYLVRHSGDDSYEDKLNSWPDSDFRKLIAYGFLQYDHDFDDFLSNYVQGIFESPEDYLKYRWEEYTWDMIEELPLPSDIERYIDIEINWAMWARDSELNGEFASWELDGVPGVLIISPA